MVVTKPTEVIAGSKTYLQERKPEYRKHVRELCNRFSSNQNSIENRIVYTVKPKVVEKTHTQQRARVSYSDLDDVLQIKEKVQIPRVLPRIPKKVYQPKTLKILAYEAAQKAITRNNSTKPANQLRHNESRYKPSSAVSSERKSNPQFRHTNTRDSSDRKSAVSHVIPHVVREIKSVQGSIKHRLGRPNVVRGSQSAVEYKTGPSAVQQPAGVQIPVKQRLDRPNVVREIKNDLYTLENAKVTPKNVPRRQVVVQNFNFGAQQNVKIPGLDPRFQELYEIVSPTLKRGAKQRLKKRLFKQQATANATQRK